MKMNVGRILLRFDVTSSEPPPQGVDTIGDAIWNRIGRGLKCLKVGLRYPEEIGEPLLLPILILISTKLPEIRTVESVLLAEWNAFGVDLSAAKRAEVAAAESLARRLPCSGIVGSALDRLRRSIGTYPVTSNF
jgi:hypothetical protein